MSEEVFNLDREISIEKNVDALGKKWEIHYNRGSALCHIRPNPYRSDSIIPEVMSGQWTKPSLLQDKLLSYLKESWDMADAANAAAERTKQAKAEASKK